MGAIVVQLKHWSNGAACRNALFDFVPTTETQRGINDARRWCDTCPVRDECLMTALQNGWQGYWGGTMTAERNRLKAPKNRAKCPICKSINVVTLDVSQACTACGRSWRKGNPPVPKVKRVKRPTERTTHPKTEGVTTMGDVL